MKIKIACEDDLIFTRISYLVDRLDFLNDVAKLRIKWGFETLLPYQNFEKILQSVVPKKGSKEDVEIKKNMRKLEKQIQPKLEKLDELSMKRDYDEVEKILKKVDEFRRTPPRMGLQKDAEDLAIKYHQPRSLTVLILMAIACGEVREKDYVNCSARVELPMLGFTSSALLSLQQPEIIFSVSPHTTKKELMELYNLEMKELVKSYQEYVSEAELVIPKKPEKTRDIREWYWMWLEEKEKGKGSYKRVLEEWNKKHVEHYVYELNNLINAITRYKRALEVPPKNLNSKYIKAF